MGHCLNLDNHEVASRASSLPLGGQQLPGLYVFFDLAAHRFARFLDVVTALQAHPKIWRTAEELREAQGGVGSDAALLVENRSDPVSGYVQ